MLILYFKLKIREYFLCVIKIIFFFHNFCFNFMADIAKLKRKMIFVFLHFLNELFFEFIFIPVWVSFPYGFLLRLSWAKSVLITFLLLFTVRRLWTFPHPFAINAVVSLSRTMSLSMFVCPFFYPSACCWVKYAWKHIFGWENFQRKTTSLTQNKHENLLINIDTQTY